MTVRELIEELQKYDGDLEVIYIYDGIEYDVEVGELYEARGDEKEYILIY